MSVPTKDDRVLKTAIFSLQKYLKEEDFAEEFLVRGGLNPLKEIIGSASGNTLAYALTSLQNLMEHDRGWESFEQEFIDTLVSILVNQPLVNICRPATGIIIKLVCADASSPSQIRCYGYPTIRKAMNVHPNFLSTLVQRLQSPDYVLQVNSLRLINALLKHGDKDEVREALEGLDVRRSVASLDNEHTSEEMDRALCEFHELMNGGRRT
ncbi:uncharacterized protein VTP21DRAFT_1226 [Calcarisporiella thermophila]|uniref:uncharacterized protein n=1 Tax=Calcarisporiella thermophila TaxID=911321 RepID=UPI003743BDAB